MPHRDRRTAAPTPARRRRAAAAGFEGDEDAARAACADPDGAVRATALAALERLGRLDGVSLTAALGDPDPRTRRRAAQLAAGHAGVDLAPSLADQDATVVETAAWACGERTTVDDATLVALVATATGHSEPLCRESAVAALGALGDPRGLPAVLAGCRDRPAVRRRAVLALAPFEGPEVDTAIAAALDDRDWQVRQAAEDLG